MNVSVAHQLLLHYWWSQNIKHHVSLLLDHVDFKVRVIPCLSGLIIHLNLSDTDLLNWRSEFQWYRSSKLKDYIKVHMRISILRTLVNHGLCLIHNSLVTYIHWTNITSIMFTVPVKQTMKDIGLLQYISVASAIVL